MKAEELRIGNYVTHEDYSERLFKVISIEELEDKQGYAINTSGGKNGTWLNNVELVNPILLTKDWLIKIGFKKGKIGNKIQGFYDSYTSHNGDLIFSFDNPFNQIWFKDRPLKCENILYIHKLQNLYSVLFNEELVLISENEVLKMDDVI